MIENKRPTGRIEIVITNNRRYLELIKINPDGSPKNIIEIDMPLVRKKPNPRHLNASYLTVSEALEENFLRNNHIA